MKLYLNLLSLLWGMSFLVPMAVAVTPTETEPATEEQTETVGIEEPESSESDSKDPAQEHLEAAFPGCDVIASDVPVVFVSTIDPKEAIADSSEESTNLEELEAKQDITDSEKGATAAEAAEDNSESANSEETEVETAEDNSETANTEEAEAEPEIECPTVEEVERYQQFMRADNLYKAGDKVAAAEIYRELKESWTVEAEELEPAIYELEQLSPGGKVYWRNYQQGKEQNLSSKVFTPLKLIVAKDPNFIPGHIAYAQELTALEKTDEAHEVMERAIGLYPLETPLLKAKIEFDVAAERWLEASIAARQFALFNPEHPEAEEFKAQADSYLQAYQDQIKEELTWNAIGNAITGAAGFALTGNLYGPISAVETTMMLLQGEAKLGDRFARRAAKQLPLVEDEAIVSYVQRIGDEIAAVAGRDEFEYEFYVIMDDNLNAFALPGGKVFVNLGVLMNTDSEAELAGLLAHEVAHSVLSHGFQLVTRGSLTANVAQYIPYVGSTASNLIVMNYSRDMERQADVFGTRILVAAGYSADGVKNLMEQLGHIHEEDEDYYHPPVWLSTHPLIDQRVDYIKELIVSSKLNRYAYEGVAEHQLMKVKAHEVWREYQAEKAAEEDQD